MESGGSIAPVSPTTETKETVLNILNDIRSQLARDLVSLQGQVARLELISDFIHFSIEPEKAASQALRYCT